MIRERRILVDKYVRTFGNIHTDLKFKDGLTIITGKSGSGKSFIFKNIVFENQIKENDFFLIDAMSQDRKSKIGELKNRVIVIDNASSILKMRDRRKIAFDFDNQYIIFSHSISGFMCDGDNIAELVSKNGNLSLVYQFENV